MSARDATALSSRHPPGPCLNFRVKRLCVIFTQVCRKRIMHADAVGRNTASKLDSRVRNLQYKRAKGEASCAECRRLKLKCDRKIPCTSCVRRGCQIICPNGSLSTGQGSRFVLANTDMLHEKLLEMSKRIRQLEDALQISHSSVSPTTHPLLSEELLSIKSGVDPMFESASSENEDDEIAHKLSADLGTLSISERGEACFMGRGSEALLMVLNESLAEQERHPADSSRPSYTLPQLIILISDAFPFSPDYRPKERILEIIEARLPSYARATALGEAYLANIAWSCITVDREQIFEELLPTVYKRQKCLYGTTGEHSEGAEDTYVSRLSLLLNVFAAGAAGDLTLPVGNDEAELYNNLARAAMSLKSVFMDASVESVQSLLMLGAYDFNSSRRYSLEPSWKMMYFGLTLASSIGLHRDPARWNLESKLARRRRRLFWEIFGLDKWKSLESGRPAIFNLHEIDCGFPEDIEAILDENGSLVEGYRNWKYRFLKEVLAPIAEQLCRTKPHKYSEILELDRKLRDFKIHPSLQVSNTTAVDEDVAVSLRRYNWAGLREIALLFVHRSLFARTLLENPTRPLGSPYASSLLSAYASAVSYLNIVRISFGKHSNLAFRQWVIWAHGLTCSVVIGCVACRGHASPVSAAALKELESALDLFKKAQVHPLARSALPFLQRLLEKARNANQPVSKGAGNAQQELSVLGGIPIVLNRANRKSPPSSAETSPISHDLRQSGRDEQPVFVKPGDTSSGQTIPYQQTPPSAPLLTPQDASYYSLHEPYRQSWASMNHTGSTSLSGVWPGQLPYTNPAHIPPSSSTPTTSQVSGMFNGWHRNSQDLSSTSWLEELSGNIPVGFGQDNLSGNSAANLAFLFGIGTQATSMAVPAIEQGDGPIVAEAWRSLFTDS